MTPNYKDRDWLQQKYWDEGLTSVQMGELCGCSHKTITNWMRKLGVRIRTLSERSSGERNPRWMGIEARRYVCEQCGKVCYANLPGERLRFCSHECSVLFQTGEGNPNWKGGLAQCTCEQCGKEFEIKQCDTKNGWGRFCSRSCHGAWQSENQRGENSPTWAGGKIDLVCEHCGETFQMWPGESDGRRFCSRGCSAAHISGENHHCWQGGISFAPYPPTFNEAFKRMIRDRDGHKCAICKLAGKAVHHINYIKDDTNPENCLTLCKRCHGKTNNHRSYWQAALTAIMQARLFTTLPIYET